MSVQFIAIYTLWPKKNKTRVILNILYIVSLLQWNLACDILMVLAIKCTHNLSPHLSYISTLPHITQEEVKVIWQKAPHGGPIPRLGVTPGGRKLYHWIPGVGFPISVP